MARTTNADLLLGRTHISDGTEKAIEEALKHLPNGKIIEADNESGGGFELTVGVSEHNRVYEIIMDKNLHVTLREERPEKCPHWVERDIRRAKRNL